MRTLFQITPPLFFKAMGPKLLRAFRWVWQHLVAAFRWLWEQVLVTFVPMRSRSSRAVMAVSPTPSAQFLSLTLKNDGPLGHTARVFLDGHEITHGVQKVSLHMIVGEPNQAELTILVDRVEVDAAIQKQLMLYGRVL